MTETIHYYSDVLCVWAWVGHIRLQKLIDQFDDQIEIESCFCPVFSDAHGKIKELWSDRGGFEGFAAHVQKVASEFPHVAINEKIWREVQPRTSSTAHFFLKSLQLIDLEDGLEGARLPYEKSLFGRGCLAVREAFFTSARDISDWKVLREIAEELGADRGRIDDKIRSSEAAASLDADHKKSERQHIEGSPTFVMNSGRQKLFGNVGYRLLEANVEELLRAPNPDNASWC